VIHEVYKVLTAAAQGPERLVAAAVPLQRVSADPQPGFHIASVQRVSVELDLAHRNSEDNEIPRVNKPGAPDKNAL
jgi:hypothetical protein